MTTVVPAPASTSPETLIICDTNVVVMMVIFNASVMFKAHYSFGMVEVHASVTDELELWITRKNAKYRRLGGELIQMAIDLSPNRSKKLREPTQDDNKKNQAYLSALELRLAPEQKGTDTSKTDKDLVAYARKNNANLATQELTLRSLASKSLGQHRVQSFEELVRDLYDQGKLTREDVQSGVESLEKMGETLRTEGRKLLSDILRPQP